MKRRFIHTLPIILFSVFAGSAAYAQDAGFPSDDSYETPTQEKVNYAPGGEGDPIGNSSKSQALIVKDSTSIQQPLRSNPAAEPAKVNKQPSDDDSVLSFNFLYYIIRKYKLQDIID